METKWESAAAKRSVYVGVRRWRSYQSKERLLVVERMPSRSEIFNACEKLWKDASQFDRINWPNEGIALSYFHNKRTLHPRLGEGPHATDIYTILDQICNKIDGGGLVQYYFQRNVCLT